MNTQRTGAALRSSTTVDPLRRLQDDPSIGAAPDTPARLRVAPIQRRDKATETPRGTRSCSQPSTPTTIVKTSLNLQRPNCSSSPPLDNDLVEMEGEAGGPEVRRQVEVLQRQRLRVAQPLVLSVVLPKAVHHQRPSSKQLQRRTTHRMGSALDAHQLEHFRDAQGEGGGGDEPREPQRRDDAAADVVGRLHASPGGQQEAAAGAGHARGREQQHLLQQRHLTYFSK
ncbi:unnamed protein product [Phytophthora fragariaefolia]|uniref:Unnamed protein product n=1 Tax=Phytophthora fragariaefolia TaxID=1490495 RepID=A0A9W6UCK8_9STRA|nr:unnamed protein product [Phytophthora fragariaefolia]